MQGDVLRAAHKSVDNSLPLLPRSPPPLPALHRHEHHDAPRKHCPEGCLQVGREGPQGERWSAVVGAHPPGPSAAMLPLHVLDTMGRPCGERAPCGGLPLAVWPWLLSWPTPWTDTHHRITRRSPALDAMMLVLCTQARPQGDRRPASRARGGGSVRQGAERQVRWVSHRLLVRMPPPAPGWHLTLPARPCAQPSLAPWPWSRARAAPPW